MADRPGRAGHVSQRRASYRVICYLDRGLAGAPEPMHTTHCPDQARARDLAVNLLLDLYLDYVHPLAEHPAREDRARQWWCELIPGAERAGRWEPDPGAAGEVDAFFLDASGRIIVEPFASALLAPHSGTAGDGAQSRVRRRSRRFWQGWLSPRRPTTTAGG